MGSEIFSTFSIVFFLTFVCDCLSLEYKCYKDICDISWQFCNHYEQKCEACNAYECEGKNNFVKYDQCEVACKDFQSTSTTITTIIEPQTTNAGISLEAIHVLLIVILFFVVITFALIAIAAIVYWLNRKKEKTECHYKDEAKKHLLDDEIGPTSIHVDCTEDNKKCVDPTINPSAPPSYESERPVCHPTSSLNSSSEMNPTQIDFIAEHNKCQDATEMHEVTPKYV